MKKIVKCFFAIALILIILVFLFFLYIKVKEKKLIASKRQIVEIDEAEYGEKYQQFVSEQYKETPKRIVFKKENTINEFYVIKSDEEELKKIIVKNDFIPKEQIISGYKYMNPSFLMD